MYRVTAQTKKTQLGMCGIFERDWLRKVRNANHAIIHYISQQAA